MHRCWLVLLLLLTLPALAQDSLAVAPALHVHAVEAETVELRVEGADATPLVLSARLRLARDGTPLPLAGPEEEAPPPFDWFTSLYTFLGGLGIFFFGMKNLSEALQGLAGGLIRKTIRTLTSNRFSAVIVGLLVTTLVQSSSVTTVMVVGFVNASLMTLTQAIGVILGANIGTTITGWIISIKVGKYGLLLIGLGVFPILFSSRSQLKAIGRVLLALGFVFLGLELMSQAFKPLKDLDGFQDVMTWFTAATFPSLLACVAVGAGLTFIVQSSSAMLGVTIALAVTGAISFQSAVALVLGENIGTTITALLAAVGANTDAKRAARAHAIFNAVGVALLLPFFWPFLELVGWAVGGDPEANVAVSIATAHSLFNVTLTLVFLPVLGQLARLVTWLTPAPKATEVPQLKFLGSPVDINAPELGLSAAESELGNLAGITGTCLELARSYVLAPAPDEAARKRILRKEEVTDHIQAEMTSFLSRTAQARLTLEQATRAYALIRSADELESVADYCVSLIKYRDRLQKSDARLSDAARLDLEELLAAARAFYDLAVAPLTGDNQWDATELREARTTFKTRARAVFAAHRARVESGDCAPLAAMLFSDLVGAVRKVVSHTHNLVEALTGTPTVPPE